MTPHAKLAVGGGLAGLMLTLAMATPLHGPVNPPLTLSPVAANSPDHREVDLTRCRMITAPDPACAQVWEQRRRHFFGKDAGHE